jgi:hypothetical protein
MAAKEYPDNTRDETRNGGGDDAFVSGFPFYRRK